MLFSSPKPVKTIIYNYKKIEEGMLPEPFINIEVQTPVYGKINLKFLVDTGADVTILPINPYADLFSFNHTKAKSITIKGIARSAKAYGHEIKLTFNGKQYPIRCYFIAARTIPLLGRLDVWDHFSFYFNNKKQQLELFPVK